MKLLGRRGKTVRIENRDCGGAITNAEEAVAKKEKYEALGQSICLAHASSHRSRFVTRRLSKSIFVLFLWWRVPIPTIPSHMAIPLQPTPCSNPIPHGVSR